MKVSVLTVTKCIDGRVATSVMAAVTMKSFLCVLTQGLTYCGGINSTLYPNFCHFLANQWEPLQDSIEIVIHSVLAR